MRSFSGSDIVLKVLGLLLIVAAVLKGHELLTVPVAGNEDFLRIALIEVPPYGQGPVSENSPCILGRLAETKEWFVTTPAVALLTDGQVISAWEEKAPDFYTILQKIAKNHEKPEKLLLFSSTIYLWHPPYKKGGEHCDRIVG